MTRAWMPGKVPRPRLVFRRHQTAVSRYSSAWTCRPGTALAARLIRRTPRRRTFTASFCGKRARPRQISKASIHQVQKRAPKGALLVKRAASTQLLEHRIGIGNLELARAFDVERLDYSIVDERRKPLAANAHAARHQVEFESQRLGVRCAAVAHHAHLAAGLL